MSKNDITGDAMTTKASTEAFRSGWDRIFGAKKLEQEIRDAAYQNNRQSLDSSEDVLKTDQVFPDSIASRVVFDD